MTKDNVRYRIIQATKQEINDKGKKFTLDEVAKKVGISKKTIYNNFEDKSEILHCLIEEIFEQLEETRMKIINDTDMDIVEKIKKLIGLVPLIFFNINLQKYEDVYRKYPKIVEYANSKIEDEWGYIEEYLSMAMKQGRIKRTNLSAVKIVSNGTIRYYLMNKDLCTNEDITISEIVSIIMNGLRMK